MITTYTSERNNKIRKIQKMYSSGGNKSIRLTNNIKAINVVSTLQTSDIDRNSITSIEFGDNVVQLDENCLSGCRNLQYVKGASINKIGDRAFCDCQKLNEIEFFNKGTTTTTTEIGERAFSNTGLTGVYIRPDWNANIKLEPYIFADCRNLKYVETIQFNTFGDYQFQNCSSLETVKMANSHGYMGKYAFQNCSSLKNVTIPAVTWGIGEGMFSGCTSLSSIQFIEPSELNLRKSYNNYFLSGTNISSITFPSSLTELDYLDDMALYGMNNLKEIHFNGMSMDKLVTNAGGGIPTLTPPYIWSIASDLKIQYITSNYQKSEMTGDEFERFARLNNIAIFTFYTVKSASVKTKRSCSEIGSYFSMESFKLWMNKLSKPIVFLERHGSSGPYYTFSYYSTTSNKYITSNRIQGEYEFSSLTQDQREQTLKTIISEILEPNINDYLTQSGYTPTVNFEEKYPFNTLIGSFESHLNGAKISTLYYDIINDKTDKDIFGNLFLYARSRHVPIIVFWTGSECGRCVRVFDEVKKQEFKTYIDNLGDKKLLIVDSCDFYKGENSPLINRLFEIKRNHEIGGGYVYLIGEYLDNDNILHTTATHFSSITVDKLTNIIDSWLSNEFSSYTSPQGGEFQLQIINSDLQSTNCFGVNHEVKIFSNDGRSITFTPIGESSPPEFKYNQMQVVDNTTIDDFKYGQWYGNVRELKQFADVNHIPVMVEIGSEGCPPCQTFNASVYQDDGFQTYIQNDVPILLGKVEGVGGNTNIQFIYAYNTWCNQSDSTFPKGKLPLMLFYWKKTDGSVKIRYVPYQKGTENDELLSIDEIRQEISNFIIGYTRDTKFNKPTINKYITGYPRYIRYDNVPNDDYGRYIPVKNTKYQGSITLSVNNSSGVLTQYTINEGQTENIPPLGTYQYFTLPQDTDNYDVYYQREGVIFKVSNEGESRMEQLDMYSYGSKQLSTYENTTGLSEIMPIQSDNFSIYQEGTTDLVPGLANDEKYNLSYTYNLTPTIHRDGIDYYKVKIYLSATVQYNSSSDTYTVNGTPYVLTANWYHYINNEVAVQWLKGFDNIG